MIFKFFFTPQAYAVFVQYLKRVGLDDDKENGDNEVRRISLRQVQSD